MQHRAFLGWGLVGAVFAAGADWPQFRGPGGTGVADEAGLPVRWSATENVRWKAPLPGQGVSGPVVAGGRVYVTACSGFEQRRLHVLCFDEATGRKRWERQLAATGGTLCHPKNCMAAPTPATDGERVYALFGTGDLVALDANGNLLWYRALTLDCPGLTNQLGLAASLVLWHDLLLLPMDNAGVSFAAGLDKLTGRDRWKVPRPRSINWVTPLVITRHGRDEVLFQSAREVTALDPATGAERWTYPGQGAFPDPSVPSPAFAEGLVVLAGGLALRPTDGRSPEVAWRSSRLRPAYASPLCYRGRVYAVNNSAIRLDCFNLRDGKPVWQQRVRGPFSGSPVAGDGKVYLVNEDGVATVLAAGDRPHVLAVNPLGESVLATPAIADGSLFLRTDRHLYRIGESARQSRR